MKKIYAILSSILITTSVVQAQYTSNTGPSLSLGISAPDVHRSFFYDFANSGHDLFIFSDYVSSAGSLVYSWDYQANGVTGSISFGNVGSHSAVVGDPSGSPYSLQFYKNGNDVFVNAFEFAPPNTMNPIIVGQFVANAPGAGNIIEADVDHMGNVVVLIDDERVTTTDFFITGSLTFTPIVNLFGSACTSGSGSIADVAIGTEIGGGTSTVSLSTNISSGLVKVFQVPLIDLVSGTISSCSSWNVHDPAGNTLPSSSHTAGPIAARFDISLSSDYFSVITHENSGSNLYVNTWGSAGYYPNNVVDVHNQDLCYNDGRTYFADITYSQDFIHVFFQGSDCNGYFNGGVNGLRRRYNHNGLSPSTTYSVLNSSFEDLYNQISANSRHSSASASVIGSSYIDANSVYDVKYRVSAQASIQLRKKNSTEIIENNSDFSVFPNPVIQNVSISGDDLGSYNLIIIKDIIGKTVLSSNLNGRNNQVLDLSSLEKGVYTISLLGINGEQVNKRIIKQ